MPQGAGKAILPPNPPWRVDLRHALHRPLRDWSGAFCNTRHSHLVQCHTSHTPFSWHRCLFFGFLVHALPGVIKLFPAPRTVLGRTLEFCHAGRIRGPGRKGLWWCRGNLRDAVRRAQCDEQASDHKLRHTFHGDEIVPFKLATHGPYAVASAKIETDPAPIGTVLRPFVLCGKAAVNALLVSHPVTLLSTARLGEVGAN